MGENTKTLIFAAGVCLSVSLLLSGTAAGLKDKQEANERFDVKRNIVKAFGIDISDKTEWPREKIEETYAKYVTESEADGLPVYTWTAEGDEKPSKYAFPISGKGLWSMLYGYVALQSDLETIAGITFYKHGETPGLGAEIEKKWFQEQFTGKKLYQDGNALDFVVAKPGAAKGDHAVDGISGATLTGKGVEILLRKDAAAYAGYFNQIKRN